MPEVERTLVELYLDEDGEPVYTRPASFNFYSFFTLRLE